MDVKDISWNDIITKRFNHSLLPKSIRGLIIGKSGCGKTTLLLNLLLCPGWLDYNNLSVFVKSLFQPEYRILKKAFEEKLPREAIMYGVPFSHLFTELQISAIEVHISPIQLQISPIQLEISAIQLEISPNRVNCRYLQFNWRYLQFNWRYLQIGPIWRYLQFNCRYLQFDCTE